MPIPVLAGLLALAWGALAAAASRYGAIEAALLAPVLAIAGGRLRSLRDEGVLGSALPAALGQVVLGGLILGGAIHGIAPAPLAGSGAAAAMLLGLVLCSGEPRAAPPAGTRSSMAAPSRLGLLVDAGAVMALLFSLPILAVLARMPMAGGGSHSPPWIPARDILIGFAAGAGAGIAGVLAARTVTATTGREVMRIVGALAAAAGAAAAGGSIPIAAFTAGAIAPRRPRSPAPPSPEGSGRRVQATDPADFPHEALVMAVAGAGLLGLAFQGRSPSGLLAALPWGLALWAGSIVIRILVQLGFSGLRRWRRPAELPAGWLPAMAWASHPGFAALGLLLLARAPEPVEMMGAIAIAIGALVQGATAGLVLRRSRGSPLPADVVDRWEILAARGIAIDAELRMVEDLRSRGEIDEEAAGAMEDAIQGASRGIAMAREEMLEADPSLRKALLIRAVRDVLEAGLRAVATARRSGRIGEASAGEVEDDLERRLRRSGTTSMRDLLGTGEGPPVPHLREGPV